MAMENLSLTSQDTLFLLIDFQTNLASAMKTDVFEKAERNVGLLISASNVLGMPILVTEQYSRGLGSTVERIKNALGKSYKPLEKLDFSAWRCHDFHHELIHINRRSVIISGIEAHVCVLQTGLDLVAQGYNVHVAADTVCSRYKEDWSCAIDYLRSAGAVITTTEIAVFQLLNKAGTPEFKVLSPSFKNKETFWSR
jgi:nicotinamidase-related amidase